LAPWLAIDSIVLARAGEVGALNSTSVSAEADSGPIRQYLEGAAAAKGESPLSIGIQEIDYDAHLSPYSLMVTGTFDLSTV